MYATIMNSIWPSKTIVVTANLSSCKDCEVLRTFKQMQILRLRQQTFDSLENERLANIQKENDRNEKESKMAWSKEKSENFDTIAYCVGETYQFCLLIDNYQDSYEKMFANEMQGMADRRGRSETPFFQGDRPPPYEKQLK
eukprot:Pgem_evm1s918